MKNKIIEPIFEVFGITTKEQWGEILSSKDHKLPIQNYRATILGKRTSLFSFIFAILIPGWSVIDFIILPYELWYKLAILRLLSGFIFIAIFLRCRYRKHTLNEIFVYLCVLMYTPTIFYLIATPILDTYHFKGLAGALVNIYSLLPFLVIASLSIFTLTIKELLIIILPLVVVTTWSFYPQTAEQVSNSCMFIWLLLLLVGTSSFSSLSQMRSLISQITSSSFDILTDALTRRAGIDTIEVYFRMAQLQNSHLTLLFLDLDNFKTLNDKYGHDAGDIALKGAVQALKNYVRKGDAIIRWGGEEFLVLLPQSDKKDAQQVINRIFKHGLGQRPEGKKLTASMGMSEINNDKVTHWKEMVELADQRMYVAKRLGRARCIGPEEELLGQVEE